ncbi:MAG: hypothetical protein ABS904_00350 [Solibacillus isronensis]
MIIELSYVGLVLGAIFSAIVLVALIAVALEYFFPLSKKPNYVTAEQFKASKQALDAKQIR